MAIRHVNVSVRRDELTVLKTSVAAWEVPILHLVHNEGAVSELPGEPWADVDPPKVEEEYQRLANKYRPLRNEDGSPSQLPVAVVYGPFGSSPQLRQAIQEATFERPADLLGLSPDQLEARAVEAEEAAKAARATADGAKPVKTKPAKAAKVEKSLL